MEKSKEIRNERIKEFVEKEKEKEKENIKQKRQKEPFYLPGPGEYKIKSDYFYKSPSVIFYLNLSFLFQGEMRN